TRCGAGAGATLAPEDGVGTGAAAGGALSEGTALTVAGSARATLAGTGATGNTVVSALGGVAGRRNTNAAPPPSTSASAATLPIRARRLVWLSRFPAQAAAVSGSAPLGAVGAASGRGAGALTAADSAPDRARREARSTDVRPNPLAK